jgi:hypothetical protein
MTTTTTQAYAEFLDHPGRPGPFGALMDEAARAAIDLCRVAESFSVADFAATRAMPDGKQLSPQKICIHIVRAATAFSDDIRKARGMEVRTPSKVTPEMLADPKRLRVMLADAFRYTEGALEGLYDADYTVYSQVKFTVSWGVVYDAEMLLEHGVCHLLRHRRQLERWGK